MSGKFRKRFSRREFLAGAAAFAGATTLAACVPAAPVAPATSAPPAAAATEAPAAAASAIRRGGVLRDIRALAIDRLDPQLANVRQTNWMPLLYDTLLSYNVVNMESETFEISMRASGSGGHIVYVRLNSRVIVPMLLDTGASDVVITWRTAERLGLTSRHFVGEALYATANGTVVQPIVRFDTVSVGDATARAVRGSISDSLEVGLLGTSFLKKFEYKISGNTLTLIAKR